MDMETLIVRVGVAVLVVGIAVLLFFMLRGSKGAAEAEVVARRWMECVATERYDAAYGELATAYQSGVGRESFRQTIAENGFLRGMQEFRTLESEAARDRVRIRGELESSVGPAETTFHLVREQVTGGSVWRISGVIVSGQPALPLPSASTRP